MIELKHLLYFRKNDQNIINCFEQIPRDFIDGVLLVVNSHDEHKLRYFFAKVKAIVPDLILLTELRVVVTNRWTIENRRDLIAAELNLTDPDRITYVEHNGGVLNHQVHTEDLRQVYDVRSVLQPHINRVHMLASLNEALRQLENLIETRHNECSELLLEATSQIFAAGMDRKEFIDRVIMKSEFEQRKLLDNQYRLLIENIQDEANEFKSLLTNELRAVCSHFDLQEELAVLAKIDMPMLDREYVNHMRLIVGEYVFNPVQFSQQATF